ncbi:MULTISPECIES: AurF N-oxygenase family protein [Pseudonocardia]|uniref:p-aminobenzoate N-oxygenase AurF n=2 Tax=Pseudonocardia TaxID=1847 RepID=A0A1Y2N4V5_PSEAH|nr:MULTISPECIES: diiron oxygenase [Pseudonocardia]OSY42476.1 P-aminobenzoate N-oxygenase AurF [Pseudonocardia autotrophica]TDN75995.1 para-aminobenzoate N-oxygenase AurF [Pseudonocardia autotrophica]BBF99970.1 membrane protein [Pseudonocardia autotrophica]GEC25030.1 membrane protein [Pseudonocardia saturnea]
MSAPARTGSRSRIADREDTARRLLRSSVDKSYDPSIDIDWEAPLVEGAYGVVPERVSLYGTPLWDELSEEQRVTLSVHEFCSVARIGLWFEMILMQMLLRYAYDRDPRRPHIQYALVEIADECRHSMMFAKATERYGVPDYAPDRLTHELGRVMKTIGTGPAMFAGTLYVEEILDQLQREGMRDERVQPLSRMINKIHVTEEARHVRYAREELQRIMPKTNAAQRSLARNETAAIAFVVARNLIHPEVYRSVGIEPSVGRKIARANPHHREMLRWSARKLVPFLREQGVIGGPSELLWKRAHLI